MEDENIKISWVEEHGIESRLTPGTNINLENANFRLQAPLEISWSPKEDITVYELAKILPLLIQSKTSFIMPGSFEVAIKGLDEKCLRHFRMEDPNFEGTEWTEIK